MPYPPAVGVGAGNVPVVIDDSADIKMAVSSIIHSKTFDNGMICASEQSVTVMDSIYDEVKKEFAVRGREAVWPMPPSATSCSALATAWSKVLARYIASTGDSFSWAKGSLVTDSFLYQNGYTKPITDKLDELGITYTVFSNVQPDPTLGWRRSGPWAGSSCCLRPR